MSCARNRPGACSTGQLGIYVFQLFVFPLATNRVKEALQAYKQHVADHARADWNAMLVQVFGLDKVSAMKKPPKESKG